MITPVPFIQPISSQAINSSRKRYGNASIKTGSATIDDFTVDKTAPSITTSSIASSNGTNTLAKSGDTITLTIVADEAIASPTVAFQSGGANVAGAVTVAAGDDDDATTWSASYVVADADTDVIIMHLTEGQSGYQDFSKFGGLLKSQSYGTNGTGDIKFTTTGAGAAGDAYQIIIRAVKEY